MKNTPKDALLKRPPTLERSNKKKMAPRSEAADLTVLLQCLQSMRDGDFSARLPSRWVGLAGKVADSVNEIAAANQHMATELKRLGQTVGKEGRTRQRVRFQG